MKRNTIGTYVLSELDGWRKTPGNKNYQVTDTLYCLFKEVGEQTLNDLFAGCIDDRYTGKASDYFGATFQKTFRQMDVTKSGHVDMAIWHCIGASTDFWEVMADVFEWLDKHKCAASQPQGSAQP